MSDNLAVENDDMLADDEKIINYTQSMRLKIIDSHIGEQGEMPDSLDSQSVILKALADIDKTVLSRQKIKSAEKDGEKNREMAKAIIAAALNDRNFRLKNLTPVPGATIPTLPADLDVGEAVPGETSTENSTLIYETFMRENAPEVFNEKK